MSSKSTNGANFIRWIQSIVAKEIGSIPQIFKIQDGYWPKICNNEYYIGVIMTHPKDLSIEIIK